MDTLSNHILTVLIALPALGALLVAYLPSGRPRLAWGTGLAISALELLLSLHLPYHFRYGSDALQFAERTPWIQAWGVDWLVGLDSLSLWLVLLTTLLTPIVFISSMHGVKTRERGFVAMFLLLQAGIIGSLVALDLFLFYVFWEVMLIPMFIIIGVWGGRDRIYATVKFILYTMVGSLLMLVAILWLYFRHAAITGHGTFNVLELYATPLDAAEQWWLFLAFALAFAIKVPLWPFHTWLPDAHTEAPTGGSVILAAVLLKLGGYGFLRFALPLFPAGAAAWAPWLIGFSVVGVLAGALASRIQPDMKRLVAYSSVSHLGFAVLGIATGTTIGIVGAMVVMISHGLTTGSLFLLVGMLYERRHTRMIEDYGGLMAVIPNYSGLLRVMTLASVGLPGLSGFVGEFLVLLGASQDEHWGRLGVAFASFGMVLSAMYMLFMFQRVMMGPVRHEENRQLKDVSCMEACYMAPLLVLVVVMGLWPGPVLRSLEPTAARLSRTVRNGAPFSLTAENALHQVIAATPAGTAAPRPQER